MKKPSEILEGLLCLSGSLFPVSAFSGLGNQVLQPLSLVSLAEAGEGAVAELTDPLAGNTHHAADLLERPAVAIVQPEVEPENLRIARRQGRQSRLDVMSLAVGDGRTVRALLVKRGEALDPLARISIPGGMVETDCLGVEGAQTANRLHREARGASQFLGSRHAPQPVLQQSRRTAQSTQVGGAVERHPDRTAMARNGSLDRLANPPHGVRDKLHPPVRIKLPGGGHQTEVPLADQVDQGDATILELLRDRHHESNVVAG